jgi:hypothetical protein
LTVSAPRQTPRQALQRARRIAIAVPIVVFVLSTLVVSAAFDVSPARAAGNNIRVDPPSQSVSQGASFHVQLIANPTVPISGIQATVTFDKTKLNITAVAFGSAWTNAGASTQPGNLANAITSANQKGKLVQAAAFFLDGTTNLPAGDNPFLDITFSAIGCGTATLGLPVGATGAQMLDGGSKYGSVIAVTTTPGMVSIAGTCAGGGTPAPGTSAGTCTAPGQSPTDTSGDLGSGAPTLGPVDTGLGASGAPASPGDVAVGGGASPGPSSAPGSLAPAVSTDGGSPVVPIALIALVTAASAVLSFAWYRRRLVGAR